MNKTKTVKRRFTLNLILLIFAYVAIASGIGYWVWLNTLKFENEVIRRTQQHLLTIARAESQRIEEFISANLFDAKILAKEPLIIKYLKDDLKAKSTPETDNYTVELLFEHFKGKADFIHWLNAKGILVGGFPFVEEIIGRDESRDPDVKLMLESHNSSIDVFEANSGYRFLCICNPVIENGNFLGLTRVLVSLDTINNLVSTVRAGEKGYVWVISKSGIMMAHPKPEHRGVDIMEVRKEAFPDFDWCELEGIVDKMKSGEEGIGTYHSAWWTEEKLEIVRKLTAFSPINISARQKLWSIGVSLGYDEIAGPIERNALNNLIGAGSLLMVFSIGGIILFRVQRKGAEMEIIARSAEELRELNTKLQSEITERKQVEDDLKRKSKLIKLQQEITSTANDAEKVEDALKSCMNKICSFMGWPVGHIYMPDSTGKLIPTSIWYISNPEKFKDFQEITHKTVFESEEGLPGRTLSSSKPNWIINVAKDANFPRAQHAKDVGIKSAFAFPVFEKKNVVAVLEFFSNEIVEPDKLILKSLRFLAIQLGRIIERKRAEDEFIKTQKLESLGVLAGGIAHDFNNILQKIYSNVALAKMSLNPESEVYNKLSDVEKVTLQSKTLSQQLLTFSKGGSPIMKTIYISELIKDSVNLALSGSNVGCEFKISEELLPVEADKGQLRQVVSNIVINAVEAISEGGIIKIKAENMNVCKNDSLPLKDGMYVRVCIEDRGTGISNEHLQKIFDPYFTTSKTGSGLGLTITYSIVKKHGGHITVESEMGRGTTLCVYLPASPEKIVKDSDESKTEGVSSELVEEKDVEEATSLKGRKILFMEDDGIIRLSVTRQLRNLKYEIEEARDGAEAIELYNKAVRTGKPFSAVILDLTIVDGIGGEETIRKLLEINPDVAAIVASGYSNDPVMSDFTKHGFKGVVEKPYEIYELDEILQKVITG